MLRLIRALPDPGMTAVAVLGVDLSRFGDYPDCWRGAAADAVVAGVRETVRRRARSG